MQLLWRYGFGVSKKKLTGRKNVFDCRLSLVTSRRAKTRTTRGVARRWGFCSVCTPLHIFVSPINPTASVLCRESLSSFHNLSHCSIKRHLVFSPSLRPVRPRLGEALGCSGTDQLRRTPSPSPRPLAPFRPCPCIIITPTTITVEQDSCQRQLFCHSFHPSAFLTTIHSFDDCAFSPHLLRRNVSKLCLYPSHFLHILLVPLNDHCPNLPTP